MTDKKQLRKELITKRKKMTDEEFSKKSLRICNRLLNNSQYLKSKVIYCYYSVNKEVDLLPFIKQALEDGKIIAFPKVKGQNMDFFEVKSLEELEPGSIVGTSSLRRELLIKEINPYVTITGSGFF